MQNIHTHALLPGFQSLQTLALQLEAQEEEQALLPTEDKALAINFNRTAFFTKLRELIQQMPGIIYSPAQKEVAKWVYQAARAILRTKIVPAIFQPESGGYEKISITLDKINKLMIDYLFEIREVASLADMVAICTTEQKLSDIEIANLSLQEWVVNLSHETYTQLVRQAISSDQKNLASVLSRGGLECAYVEVVEEFIFEWLAFISKDDVTQITALKTRLDHCVPSEKKRELILKHCLKKSLIYGLLEACKILIESLDVNPNKITRLFSRVALGENVALLKYLSEECGLKNRPEAFWKDVEEALIYALYVQNELFTDYIMLINRDKTKFIQSAIKTERLEVVQKLFKKRGYFRINDFFLAIRCGTTAIVQYFIDEGLSISAEMHKGMLQAALLSGSLEMFQLLNNRFSIMPNSDSIEEHESTQLLGMIAEGGGVELMRHWIATYPSFARHLLRDLNNDKSSIVEKTLKSRSEPLLRYLFVEFKTNLQWTISCYFQGATSIEQSAFLMSLFITKEQMALDQIARKQIDILSLEALKSVRNLLNRLSAFYIDPLQAEIKAAIRKKTTIRYLLSKFHQGRLPHEILLMIAEYINFHKPLARNQFRKIPYPWIGFTIPSKSACT